MRVNRRQKLTDKQVIQIRRTRRATGVAWAVIRDAIGGDVTTECIKNAGTGKYYKRLDEIEPPLPPGQRARKAIYHTAKLVPADVLAIRDAYGRPGVSYASLAREYGVSGICIRDIVTRHTWKHVD